jgi:hypothetical protein
MPSSLFLYPPISCFPLWKEPVWKTCKNSNTMFQHYRSRQQGGRVIFRMYLNFCWLHLNRYSWYQYPISSPYCWWPSGELFEWNASLHLIFHRFELRSMEIILRYFQHALLQIFAWSFKGFNSKKSRFYLLLIMTFLSEVDATTFFLLLMLYVYIHFYQLMACNCSYTCCIKKQL